MSITAAIVKEQGITFTVVLVTPTAINGPETQKRALVAGFVAQFLGPVVLAAQNVGGRPRYYGRPDIVRFLSNVYFEQLPWRKFQVAA